MSGGAPDAAATDTIDPALGLLREFSRFAGGTTQAIDQMRRRAIFTDGVLSARSKTMAAVLWSVAARCEPCIRYYAGQARAQGATREEMGELLAVASVMGGCVGEMWALKAYHAFVTEGGTRETERPNCCGA